MLTDTHVHLVARDRLRYPWLASAPALDRDWSHADYGRMAQRLGITAALHMEVDVDEADIARETAMIAGLMATPGSLLRGAIAACRPESAGFRAMAEALDQSVVKGLRRVLHVMPDGLSQSALFRDNIRALGPLGLPFDIVMLARQLPLAAALADAAPDVTFVLDHCGVPDIAGDRASDGFALWKAGIADVARRPNVNAKISGIVAYTGGEWTLETLRPYVETVIAVFGWARVVWGSDSPVCTLGGSLEQWVAATYALTAGAGADEKAALYQRNAARIWRL